MVNRRSLQRDISAASLVAHAEETESLLLDAALGHTGGCPELATMLQRASAITFSDPPGLQAVQEYLSNTPRELAQPQPNFVEHWVSCDELVTYRNAHHPLMHLTECSEQQPVATDAACDPWQPPGRMD